MRTVTCIECPNGCLIALEQDGMGNWRAEGGKCKRGAAFAISEAIAPMRTIASTVKTNCPAVPVLPVRVSGPIPKERIFDVMRAINRAIADRPFQRGEAVIENVLGLGVDVIAESGILYEEAHR